MDITISDNKPTMTSLEIAGLVESRHDSVKRTIERLANQAVISLPPLAEVKVQRERREETVSAYRFSDEQDRKSTRLNSSHVSISYAVFCLHNNTQPAQ